ncbi:acyltransferase family protein [Niallia sp. 03190]|uniref:acyltransferase family protein n=1 Tax=Niallia sp. 03190 TaxID=3458061 RepID=UPI0040445C3E
MNKRETWIDMAKGIGIILVIMGHTSNDIAQHYFYWFHMPLFFILSGYTFKEISNTTDFVAWLKKFTKRLLIPYVSFGISLFIVYQFVNIMTNEFRLIDAYKDFYNLFYGGQVLTNYFAVFWFVTCLFVTQILLAGILLLFKSHIIRISIVALCYILAHIEASLVSKDFAFPLNADVALLALAYVAFGWYLKTFAKNFFQNRYMSISIISLSFLLLLGERFNIYDYKLDMKFHGYTNIVLDLLIPITFSLTLLLFCYWLEKIPGVNLIAHLGKVTMPIMYLHMPINRLIALEWPSYDWLLFTLIGLAAPLIFYKLSKQSPVTNVLFLGNFRKKSYRERESVY